VFSILTKQKHELGHVNFDKSVAPVTSQSASALSLNAALSL